MQSQAFHRCDAANAEFVFDDGNTVRIRSHISLKRKGDAVFTRLYTVIGKAVELFIVPNSGDHLIVPVIPGMKIKGFLCFLRGIDDVGDPSRQRFFVGESKSPALLLIAKSHQIGTGTMLRDICIFASIRHEIAQEVIAPRKLLMDDIKRPAAVVFGKVCDILQKDDGRMFRIDRFSDLEKHIAARIGKALLLAAHGKRLARKTRDKDIEIGDGRLVYLPNIALDQRNVRKVVTIGHAGVLVFIVRPYDGMARLLQPTSDRCRRSRKRGSLHAVRSFFQFEAELQRQFQIIFSVVLLIDLHVLVSGAGRPFKF